MAFEKWVDHVITWEGGYVNDPQDSGGATNKGITWQFFVSTAWPILGISPTPTNHRNLTDRQAKKLYLHIWTNSGASWIEDKSIAAYLAELALMSGKTIAVKSLQTVLNAKFSSGIIVDGIMGRKTALAANTVSPNRLQEQLINYRAMWLESLANRRPKDQKFLSGWLNRLEAFKKKFSIKSNSGLMVGMGILLVAGIIYTRKNE